MRRFVEIKEAVQNLQKNSVEPETESIIDVSDSELQENGIDSRAGKYESRNKPLTRTYYT